MSEQNIPIDIAVRKLLDWLVSRRICSRDWHDNAVKIRERIGEAIQDMPENAAMVELLAGTHINYFHCSKIVDILRETEADSKNFFGQYGSKRMKDWKQIISDYETGSVYLAEGAQILTQNVVYEIPGLKKQVQKLEGMEVECDKKEENARKRITELEDEFRKECGRLGIEGVKLKSEILSLARGIPEIYAEIAAASVGLKDACQLYQDFLESNMDEGVELRVLENLRFLIEHGNVTTYQWKYGEQPISIEEVPLDPLPDGTDEDEKNEVIDFGDQEDTNIDFCDGGGEIDFDSNEIDFGDSGTEIDFGGDDGIAFDIENVDTSNIVVEEGGMCGGVARDEEALSLLDNRRTRTIIVDELEELVGFLTQRLCETESESIRFSLGSGAQNNNPQTLRRMIGAVESLASRLTEVKMQQLQRIRDSPSYADRLADTLKHKIKLKEKVVRSIESLKEKKEEASADAERTRREIQNVLQRTKLLQQEVEKDISGRYKGRPVNISGV